MTAGQPREGRTTCAPLRRVQAGFTLPELVMVIVVLGILAIFVAPRFFDAAAFRASGYFDEVLSAARHGHKLAVASGCPVRLEVSAAGYALWQRAACMTGDWTVPVQHPARAGAYAAAPPQGTAVAGGGIAFHPDGSSSGGAVTVAGRSFQVVAATGYVQET